MAQILTFPGKALSADASREEAARSVARRQLESATAEFDRMIAHHAEIQRRMAEFSQLCEAATTERPQAEILYYPVAAQAAERLSA